MGEPVPPVTFRAFDDIPGQRQAIYDNVYKSVQSAFPLKNATHQLDVSDLKYEDYNPTKADEKKAVLTDGRMLRKLQGKIKLTDLTTGKVLDEQSTTLAHVPHMTNRGTFLLDGTSWIVRNQARLRPGVYVRRQKSGGTEAHFNVKPGSGRGYRVELEPESGLFKLNVGQSTTRLYPILRAMGVQDDDLKKAWGDELFKKNYRKLGANDLSDIKKVAGKLGREGVEIADDMAPKVLQELLGKHEFDEDTTELTLGSRRKNLDTSALVQVTQKILKVARDEDPGDNRDSQAFQSIHSAEDFFADRVRRDPTNSLRKLLWKAGKTGKIGATGGIFSQALRSLFNGTGLAATPEETNELEIADLRNGVTRMGEGGISDTSAVSRDAKGIQTSYLGLIDPSRSPESLAIGLDLRLSRNAVKGSDNQLYTQMRNAKTGKMEFVPARNIERSVIAFPGELTNPGKRIRGVKDGKVQYVHRDEVTHELAHGIDMMSAVTAMVPFPQAMKGQRLSMAARMTSQALPLREAEAPLVQGALPDGTSLHDAMSARAGAVKADKPGQVIKVEPDQITVQTSEGVKTYELYNHYPGSRKTFLHNTPTVKPGDVVAPGQVLAKSNMTDGSGKVAIGRNLRVGYLSAKAGTHEDGVVISESAAKKLASEQAYQMELDNEGVESTDKDRYVAVYGPRFTKDQYSKLGTDGVIKPGTIVKSGDPLILAVGKKDGRAVGAVMKTAKSGSTDRSVVWEHSADGEVVDIKNTKGGMTVFVKSYTPAVIGDKACYSPDHEILTSEGWVPVEKITLAHKLASRTPEGQLEYVNPTTVHAFEHSGKMYSLETTQVSLLVTDNHKLLVSVGKRDQADKKFYLMESRDVAGSNYKMCAVSDPAGGAAPATFKFPSYAAKAGQSGNGTRMWPGVDLDIEAFAWLLGAWLSEGNCMWFPESGTYGIELTQLKPAGVAELERRIAKYKYPFKRCAGGKYRWHSKSLGSFFKELQRGPEAGRHSYNKHIPAWVFEWPHELLQVLYAGLMWGDGHVGKTSSVYTTTSIQLAGNIQQLALHLGFAATIRTTPARIGHAPGSEHTWCHERYDIVMRFCKVYPEINHHHVKTQRGQKEQWVDYSGPVYCPELPRNHTLYVRRNGKPIWCGNSGRHGNKGIISEIRPDAQMPHDEQGRPLEILLNPVGVISRVNASVLVESLLGKVAEKTGKPYVVAPFSHDNAAEFALGEAAKHGIKETETVVDPETGRQIPNVFVGNQYIMKLHHLAEAKLSARDQASYDSFDSPAKGGPTGAKRLSMLGLHSLVSAGATEFIKDAKLVRGQRNDEYWRSIREGVEPMQPAKSFANDHFKNLLKGAGVNIREQGTKSRLRPLLDKDVDEIAQHEIENSETFDQDMKPVPGGLFDLGKTGGADGTRFSYIKLPAKIPHPMFSEPIARVLGLTIKGMDAVLAGKQELHGKTGPDAIESALSDVNIQREIERHKQTIKTGSASKRDAAVRALGFLEGFKRMEVNPADLMISKIPVVPPKFRPISRTPKMDVIHDLNHLYHDLFEAKKNYKDTDDKVGDAGEQYLTMVQASKAVVGTAEPTNPKHVEQQLKGLLGFAIGVGDTPKAAAYQRRVLGMALDTVGRSTITTGPELDMDQIGVPKRMAWEVYRPYIIRRLVRNGTPATEAVMAVRNQTKSAEHALNEEIKVRPVMYNRDPALHRYSMQAGWPVLHDGDSIRYNSSVMTDQNADIDGDQVNIHVPNSDSAIKDILENLLPSKTIISSSSFDVHHDPKQDYVAGLYLAGKPDMNRPVKEFATQEDAIKAYKSGKLSARDPVRILSNSK